MIPLIDQVREEQREEREREREERREIEREAPTMEQTTAPALDLVPDKGADRALGAVANGALKALDGFGVLGSMEQKTRLRGKPSKLVS